MSAAAVATTSAATTTSVQKQYPDICKEVNDIVSSNLNTEVTWLEEESDNQQYAYNHIISVGNCTDEWFIFAANFWRGMLRECMSSMRLELQEQQKEAGVETPDYGVYCTIHKVKDDESVWLYYSPRWSGFMP